jgi:DNA-binding response OmpR family regulator
MIKARKKNANVPIIFVTACCDDDQHLIEAYEAGAVDMLRSWYVHLSFDRRSGFLWNSIEKQRHREQTNRALAAVVESSADAISSKDLDGLLRLSTGTIGGVTKV